MMNNFAWAAITLLRISGASQACFGSLKDCYQCGYYFSARLAGKERRKKKDDEQFCVGSHNAF